MKELEEEIDKKKRIVADPSTRFKEISPLWGDDRKNFS